MLTTQGCHARGKRSALLYHGRQVAKVLQERNCLVVALGLAGGDERIDSIPKGLFFVHKRFDVPLRRNILSDEIIVLSGVQAHKKCPHRLRRIVVWDADHEREIVLLTNHLDFGATTIADIYKERWQIELFFKALKQNLRVKSFVGTSENALRIQIWTALIAMLLLKWLHHLSKARWSLSNLASMLRLNLFTYRDLRDWLDDPLNTPPYQPLPEQLEFALS